MTRVERPAHPRLHPVPTTPGATNVTGLLAHAGPVGTAFQALGKALHDGALSPRDRELVILRTAWRTGNRYAFGRHRMHGVGVGLSEADVDAVTGSDGGHVDWDAETVALFAAVDELCADDCVGEHTWSTLNCTRTTEQIVHLIMLVGFQRQLAGLLNTVGAELEAGLHAWE